MNGVFNTGLEFWQIIITVFLIFVGIIGIRFTFKFDFNRHLEQRKKAYIPKLQNACPHVTILKASDGKYGVQSQFESPSGTSQWQCQRCGLIRNNFGPDLERQAERYANDPALYKKDNDRFQSLLKKAGMI
jgi:hypothetical protein